MKKILLSIVLIAIAAIGRSATITITNSGTSFSPKSITIAQIDIVIFDLESEHNAVEVSQATYNSNENTPLSGGFSLSFGGGQVSAGNLTVGTHYYVCDPHAIYGMKGIITVLDPTGLADNSHKDEISIFPNPSNGNFQLTMNNSPSAKNYDLEIYSPKGEKVFGESHIYLQNKTYIEISDLPKGVYFLRLNGRKENYYRKIVVQ